MITLKLTIRKTMPRADGTYNIKVQLSHRRRTTYIPTRFNVRDVVLDLLDTFSEFVRDAAYKDVKNMQQFYDQKRVSTFQHRRSRRKSS